MKKHFLIGLSLYLIATSCSTNEPEVISIPTQDQREVVAVVANATEQMHISGMTCIMGCKGAIEKDLNAHAGIEEFSIVFEDSIATVKYDSTLVSANEIVEAVAAVGGGNLYKATLLSK